MSDWTDEAWNDFAARHLDGDERREVVLLLKEAWLHGARAAIDKAVEVVRPSETE